ncbi:hypothetical protein JL193_03775 [Polaribacter batillariae]|uniref:Peptidase C39 domain-containing protein n=1 Tax=Polaribacter batillariae TaxID=2808900 RepID=A0ABX7SW58_9FLAO|nr:cysteine peptidase family C39 domain-containing protein [Polaribacter batillariae]QTD38426.1 hypothetical protein JL193_03775 [Polaribacter batillariae]
MAKITIKQHDITDCGETCLASIASHFKLQIPIARIRQYAGTDKKGTNVFRFYRILIKGHYYCNDFDLHVLISVLTNNEVTQIFGSSYFLKNNLLSARFFQGTKLYL